MMKQLLRTLVISTFLLSGVAAAAHEEIKPPEPSYSSKATVPAGLAVQALAYVFGEALVGADLTDQLALGGANIFYQLGHSSLAGQTLLVDGAASIVTAVLASVSVRTDSAAKAKAIAILSVPTWYLLDWAFKAGSELVGSVSK